MLTNPGPEDIPSDEAELDDEELETVKGGYHWLFDPTDH